MNENEFSKENIDIAWCPGCGNFNILQILKETLKELNIKPKDLVLVSGIGQAAKIPQYFKTNYFNGLHGRALPPATGIKSLNPDLTVIAESGDGDMYGEGGNHIIHAIRRNPNITNIIHNNMVYGLTKGQASPTSQINFKTPVQYYGVFNEPLNPIALAISENASFVARAFSGDKEQTKEILKKAITHKGYALVDILQPCATFNKLNTFQWFKENTYYLDEAHNIYDRVDAFKRAIEKPKLPLGIFYINPNRISFEDNTGLYTNNKEPVYKRKLDKNKLINLIKSKKL